MISASCFRHKELQSELAFVSLFVCLVEFFLNIEFLNIISAIVSWTRHTKCRDDFECVFFLSVGTDVSGRAAHTLVIVAADSVEDSSSGRKTPWFVLFYCNMSSCL